MALRTRHACSIPEGKYTVPPADTTVRLSSDQPSSSPSRTLKVSAPWCADGDDGGTMLTAVHDGVFDGVAPADNEFGWRTALDRLAALAERGT